MVSATGDRERFFSALGTWQPAERTVRIERCRLAPKLVTATVDDALILKNDSPVAFLPSVGPAQFHETLLRGQTRRVELGRGGISTIECGFAAACGRSTVIVILHPVHTVSNAEGRFELRNVPADQDVEIHAWHPLFREAKATVRVARGGRTEVDLVVEPLPPAPTPPANPVPVAPTPDIEPGN